MSPAIRRTTGHSSRSFPTSGAPTDAIAPSERARAAIRRGAVAGAGSGVFSLVETGQANGEFGDFKPRVMAIAVRRVIDGYVEQLRAYPDFDVDEFTEEVVGLFDRATRA